MWRCVNGDVKMCERRLRGETRRHAWVYILVEIGHAYKSPVPSDIKPASIVARKRPEIASESREETYHDMQTRQDQWASYAVGTACGYHQSSRS